MHRVSVHRLRRQGKLQIGKDGGLDPASVDAYLRSMTRPAGFLEGGEAADRLKIPRREMSAVAAAHLVEALPRPGGGWWIREADVVELGHHPERLAVLGMKLEPPAGWLAAREACRILGCSRSWLSRLARKQLIRRRQYGKLNAWYSLEDVQKYLDSNATKAS